MGLGYRPSLAGRVFEFLGIVMPRIEENWVEERLNSIFYCGPPQVSSADDGVNLHEVDDSESDGDDPVSGAVSPLRSTGELAPVLLDADFVALHDGEAAWVPARVSKATDRPLIEHAVDIMPNACSKMRAANGVWDGAEGMLLILCLGQPQVLLHRGDIVAAAWHTSPAASVEAQPPHEVFSIPAQGPWEAEFPPLRESQAGGASGPPPAEPVPAASARPAALVAHVLVDEAQLERMFGVEMLPEAYYTLLRKDMAARHPHACFHFLDHLLSSEVLPSQPRGGLRI